MNRKYMVCLKTKFIYPHEMSYLTKQKISLTKKNLYKYFLII